MDKPSKAVCKNGHQLTPENVYLDKTTRSCRTCRAIYQKKWVEKNRDKTRAAFRRFHQKQVRDEAFYAYRLKKSREYKKRNPEKTRARQALAQSVRSKIFIRPSTCERCLQEIRPQAHHYDYGRYFDVLWLCRTCHEWVHHTTVGELNYV